MKPSEQSPPQVEIAGWYLVSEILPDVFRVYEPKHVNFYVFRSGREALFVDSGLGMSIEKAQALLAHLKIDAFDVLCTHAHCDHIGLNSLARSVRLSQTEWEKYVSHHDSEQISHYYQGLKSKMPWPVDVSDADAMKLETQAWKPAGFLQIGEVVEFAQWRFQVLSARGHTSGSLMFLEETTQRLYTGDLIYTGPMYVNLIDSDIHAFKTSLETLQTMLAAEPRLQIWPAHNKLPLPPAFLDDVQKFLDAYLEGSLRPAGPWPKDVIFEPGHIVKEGPITLFVREDQDALVRGQTRQRIR